MIPLILICDTKNEIDDQMAIIYALASPEIDLLGVISTQNNRRDGANSVQIYHQEAQKILKLTRSNIKTFRGANQPLDVNAPERSLGVDFMIKALSGSRSKITIACTGPATDIVNLCLLEPKIAPKATFIWLGGSFNQQETNYLGDKVAAKMLPRLGVKLLIIPVYSTGWAMLTHLGRFWQNCRKINAPIADYLESLIAWNWQRSKVNYWFWRLFNYWALSDLAAVAAAKEIGITQRTASKTTTIVNKVDGHKIRDDFFKCLNIDTIR